MDFPTSVPVPRVNACHSEWRSFYPYWERLRRLADGGKTMEDAAAQFLLKRPMEPNDVYADRLQRFSYINHFGNIKGWYTSALFKQQPSVVLRKRGPNGETAILGDDLPAADEQAKTQLASFQDDCDGSGKSLTQFWIEHVQPKLLTYRKAFVLFDLPAAGQFQSREQQKQSGALRPHLVAYSPQDAINWQHDEAGNLEWIVFKLRSRTQDAPLDPIVLADRWYIFTRTEVAVYEYVLPKQDQPTVANDSPLQGMGMLTEVGTQYPTNANATLLPNYPRPHALADLKIVPLFVQELHPDHWIGQRIASPLCRLLNLENAHDWALEQSNLAMLVIYSELELNVIKKSEANFLQLGPNDKAAFLEQSGHSFEASQKRISEVREEVYRLAYLVAQGRSSSASASAQSGYSKEQDMMPARDVLSAMGDQVRGAFQTLLQCAADRMELDVEVDVQGFDFSDRSDIIELEAIQRGDSIATIQSPTYQKERDKRLVAIVLPDINRETKQQINKEIDAMPTEMQLQQQQQEQAQAAKLSAFTKMQNPRAFADAANAA